MICSFYVAKHKKMNNVIPHDIFLKIKEAQEKVLNNIKTEVNAEIQYISQKFNEELHVNIEKIILNPFNIYLKVLRASQNNDKLYLEELKNKYRSTFHHDLQLSDGYFIMLVKHNQLICNGDPRPKQLMVENEKFEDEESGLANTIFNEAEKKKFEDVLQLRSAVSEAKLQKKTTLVPLFLQRRNSRLSLPSFAPKELSSARRQEPVSVSDNPEVSEV